MTTTPDPIQITLDGLGDITPEDWKRISTVAGHVAQRIVNDSLHGVADAIARGVYETVIGQFDLATSTVIRDENGVITGASTITKRVA
jgi:hypothetical protein